MTSVSPDYVHVRKRLTAGDGLDLPGVRLKWYDLCKEGNAIDDEVRKEARELLHDEIGRVTPTGELGFVILHRVAAGYLLIVSTWRNDNELWETVFHKDEGGFELVSLTEPAKATYCVWEMGAVLHEQQAWIRYLFSPRDAAAADTYLADRHPGALI